MSTASDTTARVQDALSDNWVYRLLPRAVWPYAQLARWDRPIGWELLMWPCFWSSALAANFLASSGALPVLTFIAHLLLFFVGSVAMRGAGCTYNDLVDEKIDMEVARTRSRPLPSGRVTRRQAKLFIIAQAVVGATVLFCFNGFSILLGLASLAIVVIYPFAKRFTDWPQFFLGLAFSWGGLMGWAGLTGSLSLAAALLYVAAVVWTIGYDTIYAHQDKEDDALIGVRSTARLFAEDTKIWLTGFYGAMGLLLALSFVLAGAGFPAYLGLLVALVLLGYQIKVLDINNPVQCLALFKLNGKVGLILFIGLVAAIPFA
ncbi:4-hydroxybenzoate octaprenyltransferase [Agrobacterium vitis]|uniref:4-hydroxybenzoate octaprenyltransferase n=1 Tax=Agrobacterium vitis TaxID=373 RepID=UPI0008725F4C|nr:4-hydroxybenzoate octaprenyltransferase [Agrobacterium vitis]MCE6074882.1 4-hydroxybenzoate octaprenyltransferase [Agrobacterium vitis]MCM2467713.1 4-hydroxybenzoate octaprenyltransferase [Agrobacterium vitis]MUO68382.1 4-hydroxybenzoate octaprenyltransferase [Agrobacterium vitis]MUO83400.1 4-hydroxybenzoate octaprenyltransferase [Agrobacterium vitis]